MVPSADARATGFGFSPGNRASHAVLSRALRSACSALLEVRNVNEGNDHPLDAIVLRPVGHDAADMPSAVVGPHLLGQGGQVHQHPARIVQERLIGEVHQDVAERTALIGRDQAHQTG